MLNQFNAVIKQARITFSNTKLEPSPESLQQLKLKLNDITVHDVNLDPIFASKSFWKHKNKAPVSYINILETRQFTVGIFVLGPGKKLPLHNHPKMHGLLKIIMGKIKVTSYTLTQTPTETQSNPFFKGKLAGIDLVDVQSDCCIVQPEERNLHEIECLGEPAAFIDILAPPYDSIIPGNGPRECAYFEVVSWDNDRLVKLREVGSPDWYWTDNFPYTGPDLIM